MVGAGQAGHLGAGEAGPEAAGGPKVRMSCGQMAGLRGGRRGAPGRVGRALSVLVPFSVKLGISHRGLLEDRAPALAVLLLR